MSGDRAAPTIAPIIAPGVLADVYAHALEGYPEEVCGLLVWDPGSSTITECYRCENRQNALHAEDPKSFPRDAGTAYNLGPDDLMYLARSLRGDRPVRVIYHSHVNVGAYFSDEDKLMAAPPGWGPLYPDVDYLVIDVRGDGARGARLFRFSGGDFVQIAEYSNQAP